MRHRKSRVIETSWLNLNKVVHPKTGRKTYEVSVNFYRLNRRMGMIGEEMDAIRRHFDPNRNRGGALSSKWKYRDRETAEQLITMALLKWGDGNERILS